jgi:endonuclease/exonuclease/phosphatase family metal-dependent hydrolase
MKYLNPVILVACLCCDAAQHSCNDADSVMILFYNVENLFDMHNDGGEYPQFRPFRCNWSWDTYRAKLDNITSVIAAAAPDIVALAEIENKRVLNALKRALEAKRIRYPYCAFGDYPNATNVSTAVLSRYPIAQTGGLPGPKVGKFFSRNILEADLRIGGRTVKLFVNHWPSKKHPESYRIAAATTLRSRLRALPASTDYVILGDLNSNYNECMTFTRKKLNDTKGTTGINHVLATIENDSSRAVFVSEDRMTHAPDFLHYNLWLELPEHERRGYLFRGKPETPDNILIPPSLYDSTGFSYADNSFGVFTWDGKLVQGNAVYRWQTAWVAGKPYHLGKGYSDHLPIYMKLVCGPFREAGD